MRCPFATWRGSVVNESPGGMIAHRGLVLHVQQSDSEAGTDAWFHNPQAQASAHFGVAENGALDQWVDTDDMAWAEAAGNSEWVSVEIAGWSGRPATDAQVHTLGRLYAWLASTYVLPNQTAEAPNGWGLGWHGMGGSAWGGHLDCPGEPIKAQRSQILVIARGVRVNGTPPPPQPEGFSMPPMTPDGKVRVGYLAAQDAGFPGQAGGWVLTADGGVLTMPGADFWGSYPGFPATVRNDPGRVFITITPHIDGTPGYTMWDQYGDGYDFGPGRNAQYGMPH